MKVIKYLFIGREKKTMEYDNMTGTIRLSINDSVRMCQDLLKNMTENDRKIEKYFDSLSESIVIHSDGVNATVEFKDLDLSDLDRLIEKI